MDNTLLTFTYCKIAVDFENTEAKMQKISINHRIELKTLWHKEKWLIKSKCSFCHIIFSSESFYKWEKD